MVSKRAARTYEPVAEALPKLLAEREMSVRALAKAIGVDQSYLSRILGTGDPKQERRASAEVAALIAEALGLPEDYFPEYREATVIEAVRSDGRLRDRICDALRRLTR